MFRGCLLRGRCLCGLLSVVWKGLSMFGLLVGRIAVDRGRLDIHFLVSRLRLMNVEHRTYDKSISLSFSSTESPEATKFEQNVEKVVRGFRE